MSTDPSLFVPPAISDHPQASPFGPVWRRSVAYTADSLLIGMAGVGIGAALSSKLCGLGPWGRLVGLFVASLYFGSLDSWVGSGQTLGKRWMKLRVVNAAGNCISLGRAFARFAIFAFPYSLYNLTLPQTRTPWVVSSLIFVIVFGVGGSTWFLIVFNGQSRQGLHDLAVESYVVYYDHSGPVNAQYMHRFLLPVLGGVLVSITAASVAVQNWSEEQPAYIEFHRDTQPIEAMDGVWRARVWDSLSHSPGGGPPKRILCKTVHIAIVAGRKANPLQDLIWGDVSLLLLPMRSSAGCGLNPPPAHRDKTAMNGPPLLMAQGCSLPPMAGPTAE